MHKYQCPNCGASGNYSSPVCHYCNSEMIEPTPAPKANNQRPATASVEQPQGHNIIINNINRPAPAFSGLGAVLTLATYLLLG